MLNWWLGKTARLIASLVAILAITACGGGGDGVGSGGFLGASALNAVSHTAAEEARQKDRKTQ
jgi:hypothetical protein